MRLGILIPEFPTQTHAFFWREIQALRGLGVEVHLLSTRRPRERCPHPFAATAAAETHYLFPPSPRALLLALRPASLRTGSGYVRSLSGSASAKVRDLALVPVAAELVCRSRALMLDHLHVHSCASAAHVVALARRLGGPPYSLHLHGDLPVYGTDHAQKSELASFVAAAARPTEAQLHDQVGLPPTRTCTLIMGVDTDRFTPPPPSAEPGGPLRAITVARLHRAKGYGAALEAVRALLDRGIDVRYRIVGTGPHRDEIEADVARLGLTQQVELVGSRGEDEVIEELRGADVFVLPTLGEASPVSVMEAMAAGLPVVCSRVGGLPDMLSDGVEGFLVEPGDTPALVAALERLARAPAHRAALGEAARRRAVAQFDSRACARRFLDAIARSAAQAHAPAAARAGGHR